MGTGAAADADLCYFFDGWMGITGDMENPRESFRPSIPKHFYVQMQKCPCVAMALTLCDRSNGPYGKGVMSLERLVVEADRHVKKGRGVENRAVQINDVSETGSVESRRRARCRA